MGVWIRIMLLATCGGQGNFVMKEYLTESGRTGTIHSDSQGTWVERQEAPNRADEHTNV